ncbi:MAG: FHA domain-containing protein [Pirellulaceae bacterium]|nr:FHA domain-containing protein [Pirellulaceae bacterium]
MQVQLKVLSGNLAGKLISVNHEKFLIGRSDGCHLRPRSDSISRRHCAIVRKDDMVLLVDLKSRNGTAVNDKLLVPAKARALKHGDKISIGKLEFEAVIEPGISTVKKDEVKSIKDAAVRVAGNAASAQSEPVDISLWLDEAEQFDRRGSDPDTNHFTISAGQIQETVYEVKADLDTQAGAPAKSKPGKLPPTPTKPSTANSKDAASEALRKFFSGGR